MVGCVGCNSWVYLMQQWGACGMRWLGMWEDAIVRCVGCNGRAYLMQRWGHVGRCNGRVCGMPQSGVSDATVGACGTQQLGVWEDATVGRVGCNGWAYLTQQWGHVGCDS